jgi:hypothetical protein
MKRPADNHFTESYKFNKMSISMFQPPWTHTEWSSGAHDASSWSSGAYDAPADDQLPMMLQPGAVVPMMLQPGAVVPGRDVADGHADMDVEDGQADADTAAVEDTAVVEYTDVNPADIEPSSGRWSKRWSQHDDGSFSYKWSFVKPKANAANAN